MYLHLNQQDIIIIIIIIIIITIIIIIISFVRTDCWGGGRGRRLSVTCYFGCSKLIRFTYLTSKLS